MPPCAISRGNSTPTCVNACPVRASAAGGMSIVICWPQFADGRPAVFGVPLAATADVLMPGRIVTVANAVRSGASDDATITDVGLAGARDGAV